MDMETWKLEHPERGLIEVHIGPSALLAEIDPGFPVEETDEFPEPPEPESKADQHLRDVGLDDIKRHVLVTVNGEPVSRVKTLKNVRVSLKHENAVKLKDSEFSEPVPALQPPMLKLESNALDSWVRTIVYKETGKPGVDLDPPAGSRAAKRFAAMAASPWKRVVYPLGAGLSKGGWALGIIIVGPFVLGLLGRIVSWIRERLPEFHVPWPNWSIPWPDFDIPWPNWNLPSLNLPAIEVPGWLEFVLEYSKVWVPVLIGLAIGALAVRRYRKSRELKQQWKRDAEDRDSGGTPSTDL